MSSEASARGQLLVLSAPSGAGKTTLARRFVDVTPGARFSISATTRRAARRGAGRRRLPLPLARGLRRAGRRRRLRRVGRGARAVATGRCGPPSRRRCAAGAVAVFDIDVQGGAQILDRWPGEAVSVLVVPPSPAELERRLRGRSTESDEAIRLRLAAARSEVARAAASLRVRDRERPDRRRAGPPAGDLAARRGRGGPAPPTPRPRRWSEACRMDRADLSAWVCLIGPIFFSEGC